MGWKFWKKPVQSINNTVASNTAASAMNQINTNFNDAELKTLVNSLKSLTENVNQEIQSLDDITQSLDKLNSEVTNIKNQSIIVKFAADLCFVDVSTLDQIEKNVTKLTPMIQQYNVSQNPAIGTQAKELMTQTETLFKNYESKRINFIKNAATTNKAIESIISGASKLSVTSNIVNPKNNTLAAHASAVSKELKADQANVVKDLQFLNEQIRKFTGMLTESSVTISKLNSKGIKLQNAETSINNLTASIIGHSGSIVNHSSKHLSVMNQFSNLKSQYKNATENEFTLQY